MAAGSGHSSLRSLDGQGYIAPMRCDGREILRRLFVTVRDRNWRETSPTQWESTIDATRSTARIRARHTSELVDFEWEGTLSLRNDGRTLRFAFEGKALRDMDVCRLGLIVLHPVESMIGAHLTAVGPNGPQHLTVTERIHPQPVVNGVPGAITEPFSKLTLERPDFGLLELRFDGDLFELEDQRNWGDASFKTYCTPLRLGFPRTVKAGTVIAHRVDAEFAPATVPADSRAPVRADEGAARAGRLPVIGREWRTTGAVDELGKDGVAWDHVHIDLAGHEPSALRSLLDSAAASAIQFGIEVGEDGHVGTEWLALLGEHRERTRRVLLYCSGTAARTGPALARCCDEIAEAVGSGVPLLAATRGYFVEFNRAVSLNGPVSGIAFPLSATVHSDDEETIMDNVATIQDIADTARQLTGRPEVVLAPLALYHPPSQTANRFPSSLIIPWLTATLKHAAAAGVTSITLGEDLLQATRALAGPHTLRRLLGFI